ncbi:MAG TPA: hypothetical protein VL485_17360 [Ktedonobacteraceae bacterium]|nr:hypothetical protein [Ktedonobacteraceae bacterium]
MQQAKPTPSPTPSPSPTPIVLPAEKDTGKILGIEGTPGTSYNGIHWVRLGYPTCGWGNLKGSVLQQTIQTYHQQGIRVLLTVCQKRNDDSLFNQALFDDVAQGHADAVQCGNEQMKQDASVAFLYIPPDRFAKFYDMCERTVHKARADTPVLLGSLDPHVGGIDYQPLVDQASYLDQMQAAMNTSVHPGGHWDWHTQTLGLIDSWHNGYPDASVNSLKGLFDFWAGQFKVNVNSGELGKHLWVVEGTGCFKGCGVADSSYDVAVAHVLALITDVQTAQGAHVPLFYFSGKDFMDQGVYWPIGVLDANGHPKPIRQDLTMGARVLNMTCSSHTVAVSNQEDLLASMYSGCSLPGNYRNVLWS